MPRKEYDFFVSYSHADRSLVERLAQALGQNRVRLWWDRWEMRPGDVLRERINDGIARSHNYIVVVSDDSLQSAWVAHELNAAFVRAIEDNDVRVIAALGPGAEFGDLPIDLRARYSLDLRTQDVFATAIAELVDLVQPEKRIRRELLNTLRYPAKSGVTFGQLMHHAIRGVDQTIQIAALRGAMRLGEPQSVIICAARSLDRWGVKAISISIGSLGRLGSVGGLLALTATLLFDNRFVRDRLNAMEVAAASLGDEDALRSVETARKLHGNHFDVRSWAQPLLDSLSVSGDDDVRHGAYFMRAYAPYAPWLGPIRAADVRADEILNYFESRVPGLHAALLDNL